MHKFSSNSCRCYPAWQRLNHFPSFPQANPMQPCAAGIKNLLITLQWGTQSRGPQLSSSHSTAPKLALVFSGLSFALEEEENLDLSIATVSMAAWHRNQWKGMKSSPVPVMAFFRWEVAFTLPSHPQGQSSYPHCLPSKAAKFLPSCKNFTHWLA